MQIGLRSQILLHCRHWVLIRRWSLIILVVDLEEELSLTRLRLTIFLFKETDFIKYLTALSFDFFPLSPLVFTVKSFANFVSIPIDWFYWKLFLTIFHQFGPKKIDMTVSAPLSAKLSCSNLVLLIIHLVVQLWLTNVRKKLRQLAHLLEVRILILVSLCNTLGN